VRRALDAVARSAADHVVISGDLTEMGTEAEFEAFAELMDAAKIDPWRVTLVPGNHDAYTAPDAFRRALEGPLAAYRATAAEQAGKVIDLGHLYILPLDVTRAQPVTRSSGELTSASLEALAMRLRDPEFARRPVVVAQHHPPFRHASRIWQWIDGLAGSAGLLDLLSRHGHVQVLHGHLHKVLDRMTTFGRPRIFGAPAVVDDEDDRPRVRMYEANGDMLGSVGLA
jgi:3',5'-cyclic AMP phosphodiesterase CpdA